MSSHVTTSCRPLLNRHVRLAIDQRRGRYALLSPESVRVLNATSAAVLELCDGRRTVDEIIAALHERYVGVVDDDVRWVLTRLADERCVQLRDE